MTDFTWTSGKQEMADVQAWDVSMGTQHPGDPRRQEGPLPSNDVKMGSISRTFFPSEAGDPPLSTSTSMQSLFVQRQKDQGHSCRKTCPSCPVSGLAQDDSQGPGMSQLGGHFYHILVTCSHAAQARAVSELMVGGCPVPLPVSSHRISTGNAKHLPPGPSWGL